MNKINQIALKLGREIVFVLIDDIVLLKTENIYCNVFLLEGKNILVSQSLKQVEQMIIKNTLSKVHRSFIINTNYIEKYNKASLLVYLKTIAQAIPVSRNIKSGFEKRIF